MKIAVLSDFHFGFGHGKEVENDCYENAAKALELSLNSDITIIAGDIFDSRVPRTDVLAKGLEILSRVLSAPNKDVKVISFDGKRKNLKMFFSHHPLIVIHGTHERRGKGLMNIIEAIEKTGLFLRLDKETIVLEKNGKKVAIHGMSGVPERYALESLRGWNPIPVKDAYNILLIHQSIDPFVYSPLEPPSIKISDLPKGFDLIVDGHIHQHNLVETEGVKLMLPGSTVITQYEEAEALTEKGFYEIELSEDVNIKFVKIPTRKFYYKIVESERPIEEIETFLENVKETQMKPVIKFKILSKSINEGDLRNLERKYGERFVLLFIVKKTEERIERKITLLRRLREQKLSVEDLGMEILKKNLEEMGFSSSFDIEKIFSLLSENEIDRVVNLLTGEQRSLGDWI